jgi:hypothetical protein
MIHEVAKDIASQVGIQLSSVKMVAGNTVGCLDVHLLHLTSKGQTVSALVYQSELNTLEDGGYCDRLEVKIRSALRPILSPITACWMRGCILSRSRSH